MATTTPSLGNCYICGMELEKIKMKNHLLKAHSAPEGEQRCVVLKIEGLCDKNYWLLVDIPESSSLSTLDTFLRRIWLECCGHLSVFRGQYGEVGMSRKLRALNVGEKLVHEYDFGTTTETLITALATTMRKKQREAVRLLARNVPPVHLCDCGEAAEIICCECMYSAGNPFFCAACAQEHEEKHEYMIPVTNSPRMGECGYEGELDVYAFDAARFVSP